MAERYVVRTRSNAEKPEIDAFLSDVEAVCRKHGLALSHEDCHGAFEVTELDENYLQWMHDAHDARGLG